MYRDAEGGSGPWDERGNEVHCTSLLLTEQGKLATLNSCNYPYTITRNYTIAP